MILRNIFKLKKNRFFENLESKSPLKANRSKKIQNLLNFEYVTAILNPAFLMFKVWLQNLEMTAFSFPPILKKKKKMHFGNVRENSRRWVKELN